MRLPLIILCCFSTILGFAQLPTVDIYYGKISITDDKWSLVQLKNITQRIGYENQPSFTADGNTIYYVAILDSVQSDVYAYSIETGATTQITATQESEYSPVMLSKNKRFSVVRVEKDSTQRMYTFKANGKKPKLLMADVDSIGYYCSIDDKHYACFLVTDTPTLVLTDVNVQKPKTIDYNVGRCIKVIPGEKAISYIVKTSDKEWMIKRFDLTSQTSSLISTIPAVSEDYVWTANGEILMPRDNQIWMFDYKAAATQWSRIITIKELKGKKIYRLAIANNGVNFAFVADE